MNSNREDDVVKSDELTLNWLKFFKFWSESSEFVHYKKIEARSLFADALAKIMTDDDDNNNSGSHPIGYVRSLEQVLEIAPKSGQSPPST